MYAPLFFRRTHTHDHFRILALVITAPFFFTLLFLTLSLCTLQLMVLPTLAIAEDITPPPHIQKEADAITSTLMSPYCPGRLLRDCPSSDATNLKHTIVSRLEKGESKEDIITSLLSTFGDELLAAPRMEKFGVYAWITPFAVLLLGIGTLGLWLKRARKNSSEILATPEDGETQSLSKRELDPQMRDRIQKTLHSE